MKRFIGYCDDGKEIQKKEQKKKAEEKLLDCGLEEVLNIIPKTSKIENTVKKEDRQGMSFEEFLKMSQELCPKFINISPEEVKKLKISRAKLIEKEKRTDKEMLNYILRDTKDLLNVINKSQNIILDFIEKHILIDVLVDFAFQSIKDSNGNINNKVIIFIDSLNDINVLKKVNKSFKENLGEDNYTIDVGKTEIPNISKILKEEGLNITAGDILISGRESECYLFFEASLCKDGCLYHDGGFLEVNFFEEDWDNIYPREQEILENILVHYCDIYKDTTLKDSCRGYLLNQILLGHTWK